MTHTRFETFGNTHKQHADILILLLHSGEGEAYLDQASSEIPHIDRNILKSYMLHEADRGTHEVGFLMADLILQRDPTIRCDVLEILPPRSFLDMNRPKSLSTPLFLPRDYWNSLYDEILETIYETCRQSKHILQLHSMCGYDPIFAGPHKKQDIDNEELQHFLKHCYSGSIRCWDLVSRHTNGKILAYQPWVESAHRVFAQAKILMKNNNTYQLVDHYPATDIMASHASILIEIPKTWIANDETHGLVDTSQIVFDSQRITQASSLLAESFLQIHS